MEKALCRACPLSGHSRGVTGRKEIAEMNQVLQRELNSTVRDEIASLETQLGMLTARLETSMLPSQAPPPLRADTLNESESAGQVAESGAEDRARGMFGIEASFDPRESVRQAPSASPAPPNRPALHSVATPFASQKNGPLSMMQSGAEGGSHADVVAPKKATKGAGHEASASLRTDSAMIRARELPEDIARQNGEASGENLEQRPQGRKPDSATAFCAEADRLVGSLARDSDDGDTRNSSWIGRVDGGNSREAKVRGQSRLSADTRVLLTKASARPDGLKLSD